MTRDPDIRKVGAAGMKLARLSVCINEKRKTQSGEFVDNPCFVDVDAWARLADICERFLSKNSTIFVEGKLQMSQWEKDGVKHQKLKIRASNVKFIPKGGKFNKHKQSNKENPSEDAMSEQEVDTFIPEDTPEMDMEENFSETMNKW